MNNVISSNQAASSASLNAPKEEHIDDQIPQEVKELVIDDSFLAEGAYRDAWYLMTVTIGESAQSIGDSAFENCTALVSVDMMMCTRLKHLGKRCFAKCSSLANVRLPPLLEGIPDHAFSECTSLVSVEIPSTVSEIGKNAFNRCLRLAKVSFLEESILHTVGVGAFKFCMVLRHIDIPSTVKVIGKSAFVSCVRLVEFEVPFGVTVIPDHTFFFCEHLQKIVFSSTVHTIGTAAFQDCQRLLGVTNAKGLTQIGERAFKNCKELRRVASSPPGLVSLGDHAFLDCRHLMVHVHLQEGLKEIPSRAFYNCNSLLAISIPDSVNVIGTEAFLQCKSLLGMELSAHAPLHFGENALKGCASLVNISIGAQMTIASANNFSACKYMQLNRINMRGMDLRGARTGRELLEMYSQRTGADLMEALRDRYADLPVHEACYRASHTTVDALVQAIRQNDSSSLTDFFGMTPLHILATSSNLRTDLLEVLLDHSPAEVIWMETRYRSDMMDFVFRNRSADAKAFVKTVIQKTILEGIVDGWGLDKWRRSMDSQLEALTRLQGRQQWHPELLRGIITSLAKYSMMETTSVLDLALWKWTLSELEMNREECLSLSRAELVIPNVMGFLWDGSAPMSFITCEKGPPSLFGNQPMIE